jgi:cytidylate kinase
MFSMSAWLRPSSRASSTSRNFKLSEKEAAEYVEKTDRVRKQYLRRYFGTDVADPHHYHLVINSGKVGFQEAAKIIVEAASRQCEPIEGRGLHKGNRRWRRSCRVSDRR